MQYAINLTEAEYRELDQVFTALVQETGLQLPVGVLDFSNWWGEDTYSLNLSRLNDMLVELSGLDDAHARFEELKAVITSLEGAQNFRNYYGNSYLSHPVVALLFDEATTPEIVEYARQYDQDFITRRYAGEEAERDAFLASNPADGLALPLTTRYSRYRIDGEGNSSPATDGPSQNGVNVWVIHPQTGLLHQVKIDGISAYAMEVDGQWLFNLGLAGMPLTDGTPAPDMWLPLEDAWQRSEALRRYVFDEDFYSDSPYADLMGPDFFGMAEQAIARGGYFTDNGAAVDYINNVTVAPDTYWDGVQMPHGINTGNTPATVVLAEDEGDSWFSAGQEHLEHLLQVGYVAGGAAGFGDDVRIDMVRASAVAGDVQAILDENPEGLLTISASQSMGYVQDYARWPELADAYQAMEERDALFVTVTNNGYDTIDHGNQPMSAYNGAIQVVRMEGDNHEDATSVYQGPNMAFGTDAGYYDGLAPVELPLGDGTFAPADYPRGASFTAPQVASWMTQLRQAFPEVPAELMIYTVLATADLGSSNPWDSITNASGRTINRYAGFGVVDMWDTAGFSDDGNSAYGLLRALSDSGFPLADYHEEVRSDTDVVADITQLPAILLSDEEIAAINRTSMTGGLNPADLPQMRVMNLNVDYPGREPESQNAGFDLFGHRITLPFMAQQDMAEETAAPVASMDVRSMVFDVRFRVTDPDPATWPRFYVISPSGTVLDMNVGGENLSIDEMWDGTYQVAGRFDTHALMEEPASGNWRVVFAGGEAAHVEAGLEVRGPLSDAAYNPFRSDIVAEHAPRNQAPSIPAIEPDMGVITDRWDAVSYPFGDWLKITTNVHAVLGKFAYELTKIDPALSERFTQHSEQLHAARQSGTFMQYDWDGLDRLLYDMDQMFAANPELADNSGEFNGVTLQALQDQLANIQEESVLYNEYAHVLDDMPALEVLYREAQQSDDPEVSEYMAQYGEVILGFGRMLYQSFDADRPHGSSETAFSTNLTDQYIEALGNMPAPLREQLERNAPDEFRALGF